MNIGLALSGGGAKGAFQQGVLEVFQEAGILSYINVLSGVSIGALQAMSVASNQLEFSKEVWLSVDKKEAFDDGKTLLERLKSYEYDVLNQGLFPVKTLDEMLDRFLEHGTLFKEVYVGATKMSKKNPTFTSILKYNLQYMRRGQLPIEFVHINTLPSTLVKKILLASTAIPVVFKPVQVGDTMYVDGGIYNNMPIKPLVDKQVDKMIVIDLFKYNLRRKPLVNGIPVYHIYPTKSLGRVLDFNPENAALNIAYGKEVALEHLNELKHFLELS